jgi:hypothetical protein
MSPQAGSVGVIRRQVVDDALGEMDITGQRFGVAGAPLAIVGPSVDARAPGFDAELSSQRQRARGALVAVLRTARGDGQLPPPWARRPIRSWLDTEEGSGRLELPDLALALGFRLGGGARDSFRTGRPLMGYLKRC